MSATSPDRRGVMGALGASALITATPALAGGGGAGLPSATDYAVRPGDRDQTPALQRALDAAAPRPLFLPPGRYRASGLKVPRAGGLVGIEGRSVIDGSGAAGAILTAEGPGDVLLDGVSLEGGTRAGRDTALLVVREVRRLSLQGCAVRGSAGRGVVLERVGGRVERCTIEDVVSTALFALDSVGLSIVGNEIARAGDNGVQVWTSTKRTDGTLVQGNRITGIAARSGGSGQYGNGVNVFRAGEVIVSGNRISDCAYTAVRDNAGDNCQITGNTCTGLGEVAIFVEFGYAGAVVTGNLVDGAASGISITNFDQGGRLAACSGNLVRNLKLRAGPDVGGIGIAAEADTSITGNVVENAPTAGLMLGWGPHLRGVIATGNVVRGGGIGIAISVAPGAGNALATGNVVTGATRGGLLGTEWERVAADLTREAARYPQLTLGNNVVG